ncbi:MAG: SBBP repeat-containing protein [Bryobacteraceae bacterium]|jgi:uncharacterized protein (TIGR03437 family)
MRPAALVLALALPVLAAAATARRYSYAGSDPAGWTSFAIDSPPPSAAASAYTTYIGDGNDYQVAGIVADASGNTYIAGSRLVNDPSSASVGARVPEVFVTKLDAAGTLVFTATLSGKGSDSARALAVDQAGNIYLAGSTTSPNFPLRNALNPLPSAGFLVKLSPDGSRLIYSTYFWEAASAIAVDQDQNLYLTGSTMNSSFPHTDGMPAGYVTAQGPPAYVGAFITMISAAGDRVLYSGVLAGSTLTCTSGSSCFLATRYTAGLSIAVDSAGNAYVAGYTNTTDLPASPTAFRRTGVGAFVTKVNASGSGLAYLTYLGPVEMHPFEVGSSPAGLALDAAGNVVLVGSTSDPAFPVTPGAYQTTLSGDSDAFVAKLNRDGSGLVWGTYLGGSLEDAAQSVALDASGNVWLTGTTSSPDFPNANGWSQGSDFVAQLSASGTALLYSARFPAYSVAQALALEPSGLVHLAGQAGVISALAPSQPFSARIFGMTNLAGGVPAGLVAPGEVIAIYGPHIGPTTPVSASADSSGLLPKSLAGVQVLFDDAAAPLLLVSDTQVNAVVPFALSAKTSARLRLSWNGVAAPDFPVAVVPTMPEIFKSAGGYAAAMNEDGSLNSADHPAKPGSVVAIWATGTGAIAAQDGEIATSAHDYYCCSIQASYGSVDVLYAGAAPSLVAGIAQINFRIRASSGSGVLIVQMVAGDRISYYAYVHVTQSIFQSKDEQ